MSSLNNTIFLRSDLAYDPFKDPEMGPETLTAFSPDIIPVGQTNVSGQDLLESYGSFVAHALEPTEANKIWVRGRATDQGLQSVATTVTLSAFPNELILWPQVWRDATVIGKLKLSAKKSGDVCASNKPLVYTPSQGLGRHDTLVATTKLDGPESTVPDANNWRELVSTIGQDTSLALYNVVIVDPTSPVVSLCTRLRIFENEQKTVPLTLSLESVGIPPIGLEASFFGLDSRGNTNGITFTRAPLSPRSKSGINVTLPPGYDGFIYLNIFNDNKVVVSDYASVSLVVTGVTTRGPVKVSTLIAAEHVVFDSNVRVASFLKRQNSKLGAPAPPPFYFRCQLGDTSTFPRTGNACASPDIQPLGQTPVPDAVTQLSAFDTDVSNTKNVKIVSRASNYIYLRANTTAAASGQVRLFGVPNTMLIHPLLYGPLSLHDIDPNTGGQITAFRSYSIDKAGHLVVPNPFNMVDPPPPGTVSAGADHYCLIAESLPDPTEDDPAPLWPHEESGSFTTGAEFTAWVLSEPRVAWRNVTFVNNPDAPDWVLQSSFIIPEGFTPKQAWTLQVACHNVPIGSAISMTASVTSENPPVPPPDLSFAKTQISNPSQKVGVDFTGVKEGFACTVTVSWFSQGQKSVKGQNLTAEIVANSYSTSVLAQALGIPRPAESAQYPLWVGPDYPLLIHHLPKRDGNNRGEHQGIRGAMEAFPNYGRVEGNNGARPPLMAHLIGGDAIEY